MIDCDDCHGAGTIDFFVGGNPLQTTRVQCPECGGTGHKRCIECGWDAVTVRYGEPLCAEHIRQYEEGER
jgi:DnaJ-class molecular chaperone